jgi:hypothetical protein
MAEATRTPRSRPVSSVSNRTSSSVDTSKEPSLATSEQPIEIPVNEDVQTFGSVLAGILVDTPEAFDKDDYLVLEGENVVYEVLREQNVENGVTYCVRFGDNSTQVVSFI